MAPVTTIGGITPGVFKEGQRKVDIVFIEQVNNQFLEKPSFKANPSRLKFKLPKTFIKHVNLDGNRIASMMLNKGGLASSGTPKEDLLSPRTQL